MQVFNLCGLIGKNLQKTCCTETPCILHPNKHITDYVYEIDKCINVIERHQITTHWHYCIKCYQCVLIERACDLRDGEKLNGKASRKFQIQHQKQTKNHLHYNRTAESRQENHCLGDPERSRGNFVLRGQGMFHHFNNSASTTKKSHRRASEKEIKSNIAKGMIQP